MQDVVIGPAGRPIFRNSLGSPQDSGNKIVSDEIFGGRGNTQIAKTTLKRRNFKNNANVDTSSEPGSK